jgi:hypothetical protein
LSHGSRDRFGWRSLSGKKEFSRVYEAGVKYVGRLFVLYLFPGDDLARAVVASKRVGNAVTRNRAKRLLREAIRSRIETKPDAVAELRRRHWPADDDRAGLWIVAVARQRMVGRKFGEVEAEFERLLERPVAEPDRSPDEASGRVT